MKRGGVFHTWIDYPKFHELVASGEHFTAADYMAPTPDWAIFNPVRAAAVCPFCLYAPMLPPLLTFLLYFACHRYTWERAPGLIRRKRGSIEKAVMRQLRRQVVR